MFGCLWSCAELFVLAEENKWKNRQNHFFFITANLAEVKFVKLLYQKFGGLVPTSASQHDGIQYSSTPSDVTLLNHIYYSVTPVFASSFLPFSFMVFLFIFVPSPQFFWSVRLSLPFLFWWPHCGCTLKMCPNYWESSLLRSNSLELWGFLLNYAICFSRHWRPGGPAFNISIHVQ